jgi:prophage regulatory protein
METIYRKRELLEGLQISSVTLWRWVRAGHFPKPLKLGPNTVGWLKSEVTAWIEARPRV